MSNTKYKNKYYKFELTNKILFYVSYLYYRFIAVFVEIEKDVFSFFIKSTVLFIQQIFRLHNFASLTKNLNFVYTKFGTFHVRPNTLDFFFVSPFFERSDINFAKKLISKSLRNNKKVLFIDIGADIGTYSVQIGNFSAPRVEIVCVEPSKSSYAYLNKNLELNNIRAKTFNFALSNFEGLGYLNFDKITPGNSSVVESNSGKDTEVINITTLNSLLNPEYYQNFDCVVLKMDIEGGEINCLRGATDLVSNSKELFLLVEDFYDPKIIDFLSEAKFTFLIKKTPYNSWWYIRNK